MQFSDAYDVYLEITHHVDSLINGVIGCNTPNWRCRNYNTVRREQSS